MKEIKKNNIKWNTYEENEILDKKNEYFMKSIKKNIKYYSKEAAVF